MTTKYHALPPFAALRPFEAAARHLSFKVAARELCVSEATVSRQIRALEFDLDTPLFERGHRQVALTAAGAEFAERVGRALQLLQTGACDLRERQVGQQVVLRVELYLAMYWLAPRLQQFHLENPDVKVRLCATTEPISLADDHFDLALQCRFRPSGEADLIFTADEAILPVCASAYEQHGALSVEALAEKPRMGYEQSTTDTWHDWRDWFSAMGAVSQQPDCAPVFDSYPLMIESIKAGHGIGLGWARGLQDLLADGSLVNPTRAYWYQPDGLGLYRAISRADNPAADRVRNWLEHQLAMPLDLARLWNSSR